MTYMHKNVAKQIVAVGTKSSLAPEDTRICNESSIHETYVVTEIKTGFRAFLLFESHVTNGENKNEIASKLKQAIQEIPSLLMENNSSSSDFTDKIMFKFYGDAIVYPAPITYYDAIKLFEKLPQMSIENEQVISFSITPISNYCPEINTQSTFVMIHIYTAILSVNITSSIFAAVSIRIAPKTRKHRRLTTL